MQEIYLLHSEPENKSVDSRTSIRGSLLCLGATLTLAGKDGIYPAKGKTAQRLEQGCMNTRDNLKSSIAPGIQEPNAPSAQVPAELTTAPFKIACAFATSLAVAAAQLLSAAVYGATPSSPSTTQSAVPTAAGDTVKNGDIIIWQVNKAITLNQPAASSSGPAPAATAAPAAAAKSPTLADTAAAASAIESAIQKQLGPGGPPPAAASKQAVAQYAANSGALTLAQDQVSKADVQLVAGDITTPSSSGGKVQAAMTYLTTAEAGLPAKDAAADAANAKQAVDSAAADAAKQAAAKPGANAAAKAAAAATATTAQTSTAAAQKAELDRDIAEAYIAGATTALSDLQSASTGTTKTDDATSAGAKYCFPNNSRFNVTDVTAASASPKAAGAGQTGTAAVPSTTQLVSGNFSNSKFGDIVHYWHSPALPPGTTGSPTPCGSEATQPVKYGETYTFTADQLAKNDYYRQGFTWGGLVVPFKFYFKDKSIKSNSSVVGFVGYEGWFSGVSIASVAAVGLGLAPGSSTSTTSTTTTTSTSTTSASTSTSATYTAAVGFIATFGGVAKAGVMFGRDYQGNAAAFPYENKTWMALSIGAGF